MQSRVLALPFSSVRLVAATTLAAFLVAAVGYPVWSPTGGKDLSSPFPCMYRQCGCRNAEQCWRGCCCFSDNEKLAWAKQNNVTPPTFVVAAAAQTSTVKKSCCASKGATSCHTAKATKQTPSLIAIIEALTCQSHLEQWVAIGAIDVVRTQPWHLELPLWGEVVCFSAAHDSFRSAPPAPPPWC